MTQVAANRTTVLVDAPPRSEAAFVLYWMVAQRRVTANFALDRAVGWARELGRPLLVFEALRVDYPWASDRLHRFVLDGMADNARRLAADAVGYYPYVEAENGEGRGLLPALAAHAAVVVTDDYPAFFLPRMIAAAARQVRTRFEAVDGNGLLPMRQAGQAFATAYAFRRYLQRSLPAHIAVGPSEDPFDGCPRGRIDVPADIRARWPAAPLSLLDGSDNGALARLPIDHRVPPANLRGGTTAAEAALAAFLGTRLHRYADDRNDLDDEATSWLSPYLHFGHLAAHVVVDRVLRAQGWLGDLSRRPTGAKEGWWGVPAPAEAFLDQVVTWRELGFNTCAHVPNHDQYESLPAWARATLEQHAGDEREHVYELSAFEQARTHDALWNAAQVQLLREGRIHNYLRMLWGKKILEWTASPRDALAVMIQVNNKYALDGRDPNSYSGIFWTLGRYDRPWAPRRPVFGTVRYMSSANTARKLRVRGYLQRYAAAGDPGQGSLWPA